MVEDERDAATVAHLIELAKLPAWHDHAMHRARELEQQYAAEVSEGMFVGLSLRVLQAVHDAGVYIEPTPFHGTDYRPYPHDERAERARGLAQKKRESEQGT